MSKSDKHKAKLDSEKRSINKKSYTNTNNSENKPLEMFKILPLLLIVGILPFVIRLKLIPLHGPFYEFWNGEKINADFFTYYKQIFIYIVTVWALLHTFLFTKKIKFTKAYYFMGFYAVLVILSTIFSKYPQIALHGFVEHREGMWVILCYLLLMFSTINLVETEKQIKAIIYTLGISGAVISIISIFQYFGMDIFATEFAKNFMISKEIQAQIKEFNIQFGEKYSYGVFYNPNYLGGYISFYAPLILSFAIISKNIRERVLFAVFFILSIFALYGSRSEAGVLGTAGAMSLLILVLTTRYIIKDKPKEEHKKLLLTRFVPILLAMVILPVSMSYIPVSDNPLARIRTEAVSLLQPSDLKGKDYKNIGPINEILFKSNSEVEVIVNNQTLKIITNGTNLILKDFFDRELYNNLINKKKDSSRIGNNLYGDLLLTIYPSNTENIAAIELYYTNLDYLKLFFRVEGDKIKICDSSFKEIKIEDMEGMKVYEKGKLGSNRGFIWTKSIALIPKNFLLGLGQDTFITEFKQNDIYTKQVEVGTNFGLMWRLIDKPHNMYIQIAMYSGLISLVTFLIFIISIGFKSVKSYIFYEVHNYLFLSTSLFGWMLSSIFNDSIIAITPIIMIIIGLFFSNITIKK